MRLRGCLWHKGSNGLGIGPLWLRRWLPYRKVFDAAARKHDAWYDMKGDGWARQMYDIGFLIMCLKARRSDMACVFAWIYFILCRMFGWMFYRYNMQ
ncbi:MAG: hypothetical protein SOZ60_05655 [Prevotella sp.]|nr:hypothetical protein [Prevotella sp.]